MTRPPLLRRAAGPLLAAGALTLASLTLVAPAAQAAPVFTLSDMDTSGFAHDDAACTESDPVEPASVNNIPVTENGPATTSNANASVTLTAADPADVMTGALSTTTSGSVSSVGTDLKSIDLVGQGTVTATSTNPVSACLLHMGAQTNLDFNFTVTTPGFLTVKMLRQKHAYSEVYIEMLAPASNPYFDTYGDGLNIEHSTRVYLPAGTYDGYVEGRIDLESSTDAAESGNVTANATFSVAGSQTEAVKGKGKRYVTLPAARSCATDSLVPSVTDKRKRVKKVKQIKFFVDDKLVKKVKKPKKGATVNLPVADAVQAEVRAEVKLFPVRKGKPAKVHEVTAAYEACSGLTQ